MKKRKFIKWPTSDIPLNLAEDIVKKYKPMDLEDNLTLANIFLILSVNCWILKTFTPEEITVLIYAILQLISIFVAFVGALFLFVHWQLWLWYACALKALQHKN